MTEKPEPTCLICGDIPRPCSNESGLHVFPHPWERKKVEIVDTHNKEVGEAIDRVFHFGARIIASAAEKILDDLILECSKTPIDERRGGYFYLQEARKRIRKLLE